VQINDTLFADETEITNFGWQEFEWWTAQKYGNQSKEHIATLPDTTVWREKNTYNEPYVKYYYRHPAYKDYPVVGISYEQAKAYCIWRTARVKQFLSIGKNYANQNFAYRLPTKAEWELLGEASLSIFANNGLNEKGIALLNCPISPDSVTVKGKKVLLNYHIDVTVPVNSFQKNKLGLYNIVGNVAEMIENKGICKGGGWNTPFEKMRIGIDMPYTKPSASLGFRCVCVTKAN